MAKTRTQAASPPERAEPEAEAAVDAGAELLSEVSQKATFPMRFGEEAEEQTIGMAGEQPGPRREHQRSVVPKEQPIHLPQKNGPQTACSRSVEDQNSCSSLFFSKKTTKIKNSKSGLR